MTCQGPNQSYSMILSSSHWHQCLLLTEVLCRKLLHATCTKLPQTPPVCPSILEYDSIVFRMQILTLSPQQLLWTCSSFQCPFSSIFLFPPTFCSNSVFSTFCCHFCESSLVPQTPFFSFPLTFINSSCCSHCVLMDYHSIILSRKLALEVPFESFRRCP